MRVNVLGAGITKFGELWDKSLTDLAIEAGSAAIKDSGLQTKQIDAVFVANMLYSKSAGQDHLGSVIASRLGINGSAHHIEAACASGGVAVHQAVTSLLSGLYSNILVIGVEKMTDLSTSQITSGLMGAASEEERASGLTFPALYALMAKAHMEKYGTTKQQLASVSVKNHFNARLNPNAQFRFELSLEKALSSPMVSDPLTLFDCSPITDGAAAVILSAKQESDVYISGSAVATDSPGLSERKSLTEIPATKAAAEKALHQAGLKISDIDLLEVHDCFTIAEIMALEDLEVCPKGQGGKFIAAGKANLQGKLPVNTSGGLKGCGHPVAATGIKQIIEIYEQLKGVAGDRQVKEPKIGLTQNVGGTGGTVAIHILQK